MMRLRSTSIINFAVSMRFCQTIVLAVALAGLAPLSPSYAQQYAGGGTTATEAPAARPLDGLQFSAGIVRLSEASGGNDPLRDTLTFKGGHFSSAVCERYNFSPAPYWIRREGDQIHYLAELTSPTDGRMVWKGTVRDGKLEGTMRWTRKRWYWTIDAEHNIRGVLKDGSDPGTAD